MSTYIYINYITVYIGRDIFLQQLKGGMKAPEILELKIGAQVKIILYTIIYLCIIYNT